MIHEVIVTTVSKDKEIHIAPMGIKFIKDARRSDACIRVRRI